MYYIQGEKMCYLNFILPIFSSQFPHVAAVFKGCWSFGFHGFGHGWPLPWPEEPQHIYLICEDDARQLCSAGFCQGRSKKSTRQTEKETTSINILYNLMINWWNQLDENQPFSMAKWSDKKVPRVGNLYHIRGRFSPQFPEDFRDLCLAADAHDPDWEAHCLMVGNFDRREVSRALVDYFGRGLYSLDAKCWLYLMNMNWRL